MKFTLTRFNKLIYFSFFFVTSCISIDTFQPVGYHPLSQNVPLFNKRNDFKSMFTFGINHVEWQLAYSPMKHIGVMANYYENINSGVVHESGIGYYLPLKNNSNIEAFALYTKSKNDIQHTFSSRSLIGSTVGKDEYELLSNYDVLSIQLNAGKSIGSTKLAVSVRENMVNFNDFLYRHKKYKNVTYSTQHLVSDSSYYLNTKRLYFLTIAPTFTVGKNAIKYFAQFSLHLNFDGYNKAYDTPPYYLPFLFTNGILFDFNFTKKKKQPEN